MPTGRQGEGGAPPPISGVLETALYVDDLSGASAFYQDVLGLRPIFRDERLAAYDAGPRSVLLLFRRGSTLTTATMPGGTIPPHDGHGPIHIALAVAADDLAAWERHLAAYGIPVEGRTDWPQGGTSVYFRDPDGHLLELATPGLWPNYRA
ncbi:VOC family protein [Enterovirga aerilata]|uniref:Glyoxalase n=1 Tax=Enterovirga aerilata TaxID=2730920 RepID=A0A849I0R0_9HYPH|nr:VOC family protein [Enterovirga sp. DB1703]NNM73346.1 glyoxalase [Enterovirga sp. DB1703]